MKTVKGCAISGGIAIGRLTVAALSPPETLSEGKSHLLLADELSPGDVLTYLRRGVRSFLFTRCSETSHAAILAVGVDAPPLSEIDICTDWHQKTAILDGNEGILIIEPDSDTLCRCQAILDSNARKQQELAALIGCQSVTKSRRCENARDRNGTADSVGLSRCPQ